MLEELHEQTEEGEGHPETGLEGHREAVVFLEPVTLGYMRETETTGDITWSGKREKQYSGFSLLLNLQSCSSTSCLQEAWETWLAGVSFFFFF